jgi:FixJ family two-component response regulator
MPRLTGIQLYDCIITQVQTKVIFISGFADKIAEALRYSVVDCLFKPVSEKRFEEATQKALNTFPVLQLPHSDISKEVLDRAIEGFQTLSPAQRRVFQQIANGKTTKQIADIIYIAEGTISLHRHRIREKLSIPSTIALKDIAVYLIKIIELGDNNKI